MVMRSLSLVVVPVLWVAASSQAALYQFTLEGNVTFSIFGSNPSVGDPVTIRYLADSQDLEPNPMTGVYAARDATLSFPGATYKPVDQASYVLVTLRAGGTPSIEYQTRVQDPQVMYPYLLSVAFWFPEGTILSDELPLTLPLSIAHSSRFRVIPIMMDLFAGNVTSYASVEIPEPFGSSVLLLFVALLRRRARMANPGHFSRAEVDSRRR